MAEALKANNVNIINMVRSLMPIEYGDRIPEATQENINMVYDTILNYKPLRDKFIISMFELIGIQTIDGTTFVNPLAEFKKEPIRFGSTDEETFINMAKGTDFDSTAGIDVAFRYYDSYIMTNFHKINFANQYPITLQYNVLKTAFMSDYGLQNLLTGKMMSAYAGYNWDEYLCMLELLLVAYQKRLLPATQVARVEDRESAENLLVELEAFVDSCRFPLPQNNPAGATSVSSPQNLIFFTIPKNKARIGVQALANAYNLSYAETKARTVVVHELDPEGKIQGIAVDVRFFRCRDNFLEVSENRNGAALSYNMFLTAQEMISPSLFYPVMVFTTDGSAVSPTITASNITNAVAGSEVEINASITDVSGYTPQLFDYEVVSKVVGKSGKGTGTAIVPGTNILLIDPNETNFPISVKITWRNDSSVTKTITVTKAAG